MYSCTSDLSTGFISWLRMLLSHLVILAFTIGTTIYCEPANSKPLQSVSLQLKWYHQFQFAGYYIAQHKGYYEQAGLDVTIIEGGAGQNIYESIIKNKTNYSIAGGGDALRLYLNGFPIKALGIIYQHSPYALLTLNNSPSLSPSDLTGTPIMISREQGEAEILAMFANEGIDSSKLNFVPHHWNYDDLLQGKVSAMSIYLTTDPYQLSSQNIAFRLIKPVEYGIDFYGDIIVASESEVEQYPDRSDAFFQASLAGWQYALTHVDETIQLILQLPKVKQRGITANHLSLIHI